MPLGRRSLDWLHVNAAWVLPLGVFVWAQAVLLAWWAGQWPGLLSPDSVRYVFHVTTGPWAADHSVLYDAGVLASLWLTRNVALLTLAQTTAAAAVLAFAVGAVRAVGVPARWAAIPGAILPLLPSFGAFVTTVWKDVPFALCEVLVAATTLHLFARRDASGSYRRVPRRLLVALGAGLLGLTLFRNDGFLVVLVIGVVLGVALRGLRVAALAISAAAILASFFAQAVVYPAVGIQRANSSLSYGLFYADIALAYAQAPSTFTKSDRTLLTEVAPLAVWRASDNCYSSDPLFRSKKFSNDQADTYHLQLFALWRRVLQRTPVTVVRARLCRSSVAWNVLPPPRDKANFGEVVTQVPTNLYGNIGDIPGDVGQNLRPQPLNASLGRLAHAIRVESLRPEYQPLMWRGATWCYIAYLVLTLAARRLRRWDLLAVGAASLANQLTVLAANPAQLYRYMVGPIFLGILLVPLLAVRRRPHQHTAAGGPGAAAGTGSSRAEAAVVGGARRPPGATVAPSYPRRRSEQAGAQPSHPR